MNNQVYLIGRIANDIENKQINEETNVVNLRIAVSRNYKNAEGVYETDFFDVAVWNGIGKNVSEYCKKGDLIGINGSLTTDKNDGRIMVRAERVTFLASKSKDNKEKDVER